MQRHEAHGDVLGAILRHGAHHHVEQQLDGAVWCTRATHELFDQPTASRRNR